MATVDTYTLYVWTNDNTSEENVLMVQSREHAIEFFNDLFLQVHNERRTNVQSIELRCPHNELVAKYDTHFEVVK